MARTADGGLMLIVHTWADDDPCMTLCGEVIRAGILTTANVYGVTCSTCMARASAAAAPSHSGRV